MVRTCGASIHPIPTKPEEGYHYADRATVEERIAAGQTPEEAEAEFLTDDYFDQWYETTRTTLEAFAG